MAGGLDVKLSTTEVRNLLDQSHDVYRNIDEAMDEILASLNELKNNKSLKGKAADGFAEFIELIEQDVAEPSKVFNEKMFKSLKTVVVEFENEAYIDI